MRRVSMPSALFSAPDFKHRNPDFRNCNAKIRQKKSLFSSGLKRE